MVAAVAVATVVAVAVATAAVAAAAAATAVVAAAATAVAVVAVAEAMVEIARPMGMITPVLALGRRLSPRPTSTACWQIECRPNSQETFPLPTKFGMTSAVAVLTFKTRRGRGLWPVAAAAAAVAVDTVGTIVIAEMTATTTVGPVAGAQLATDIARGPLNVERVSANLRDGRLRLSAGGRAWKRVQIMPKQSKFAVMTTSSKVYVVMTRVCISCLTEFGFVSVSGVIEF
jgi:hypothetical protein